MKKKIIALIIIIIVCFALFVSSIFGFSKSGTVIDSATKKPIQGIWVVRQTEIGNGGDMGGHRLTVRLDLAQTDANGKFSFKSYFKFRPPFDYYKDVTFINSKPYIARSDVQQIYISQTDNLVLNNKYLSSEVTNASNYNYQVSPFKARGTQNVSLPPIVSDIKECLGDSICIDRNNEFGRFCEGRDSFDSECKNFHALGGKIFESIKDDLVACNSGEKRIVNGKSEYLFQAPNVPPIEVIENNEKIAFEIASAQCVRYLETDIRRVTLDEKSCSKLTSEFAKNYCYFRVAEKNEFISKETCGYISTTPAPQLKEFITSTRTISPGDNLRKICTAEYEKNLH